MVAFLQYYSVCSTFTSQLFVGNRLSISRLEHAFPYLRISVNKLSTDSEFVFSCVSEGL